jgi:chromosome segregation ATPase
VQSYGVDQKGKLSMPTQEERLTALEQTFAAFQKETATHIREVDENTTIMLGVIRDQGRDIKRIVQHLETIDERLNTLEQRLGTLERRLNTLEQRIESRFETSEKKLDQVLHLLTTLTSKPDQET